MSKRKALVERLRRGSGQNVSLPVKADSPVLLGGQRNSSAVDSKERTKGGAGRSAADIFSLPSELLVQVAEHLSFQDLCSFRLVSKPTEALVTEGAIVRYWTHFKLSSLQRSLYAPPKCPTFTYLLEQRRRTNVAAGLADLLADYIDHKIMRYTVVHDHAAFRPVWLKLRDNMTPLLLTVNHYLESARRLILAHCSDEQLQWEADYSAAELELVRTYEPDHLLRTHKMWLFLSWLFNQLLRPPSYVSPVERAVRGWYLDPLKPYDFTRLLILGNLGSAKQLLLLRDYKERRRTVEAALKQLDPSRNVEFHRSWALLGLRPDDLPSKHQAANALRLKLLPSQVWAYSARTVLIEKSLMEPGAETDIGTPSQTMDFLQEIAGYDILHSRPPAAVTGQSTVAAEATGRTFHHRGQ